ncbi:phenylalanine--tRNA ligase subunit beta [Candidatus Woesearchaeota archaeon]|nr:phenylalanine--tRNA ligase subunit beta [Candidatus Woesearchaeota archaeon]
MPTIDISLKDLSKLVGKEITLENFEPEALLWIKGEIDGIDGDNIKIDCKESNRPDLWSTEGIARAVSPFYTKERGIRKYNVEDSDVYLHVDRSVDKIRPYISAAIIEDITITDDLIKQLIQIQEKVTTTFGRKRKVAAIGIYDFDKMTPPITYKAFKPTELKFIPLGFTKEMTLKDILIHHPKGQEFAHLLTDFDKYPIVIDNKDIVASMPPVINSESTGKVTEKTKNLFIEVTGINLDDTQVALNIVVCALADRGGKIKTVLVDYGEKHLRTPDFTPKKIKVKFTEIEKITGIKFSLKELKDLLEKQQYEVKKAKDCLEVEYPSYRQDIMHPVDVIEDILISYGYNKVTPILANLATTGEISPIEEFCEDIRELIPGFGAQELLNFTLTNKEILFRKMNLKEENCIEIANPVSNKWTNLRNAIIPSLMDFLEHNTSQEYPQQVYEVGDIVIINDRSETKTDTRKHLAWALADKEANFTKAKQIITYILTGLNIDFQIEEESNDSFITGRCARIIANKKVLGYFGEIHPKVLQNFSIEFPICALELDLTELFTLKK